MKKLLKWAAIIFVILIVIGAFSGSKKDSTTKQEEQIQPATQVKDAFNQGADKARQAINQKEGTDNSSKVSEYTNEIAKISEELSGIMKRRSELIKKWPNLKDIDATDAIEFVTLGIQIEKVYNEANAITPPQEMVSIHKKILQGLSFYKQSVPLINDGIDKKDSSLITQSSDLLKKGDEQIKSATAELKAYHKQ